MVRVPDWTGFFILPVLLLASLCCCCCAFLFFWANCGNFLCPVALRDVGSEPRQEDGVRAHVHLLLPSLSCSGDPPEEGEKKVP